MTIFKRPFVKVRGGFGRTYQTEEQAMQDWNEGKEFQDCTTGLYLSIRDIEYMIDQLDTEWIGFVYNGENVFSREITGFIK